MLPECMYVCYVVHSHLIKTKSLEVHQRTQHEPFCCFSYPCV